MPSIKLTDVTKAASLLKKVVDKADVLKDGALSREEIRYLGQAATGATKDPKTLAALQRTDDAAMLKTWQLRNGEQVMFSEVRGKVLRVWSVNHMIHHRGQLCLYLRLLGVPVPRVYFNSADEPEMKFD